MVRGLIKTLSVFFFLIFLGHSQAAEFVEFRQGEHRLLAEVALTPSQRSRGLMWRTEMPDHIGMLFILDTQSRQCFWMRNTYIPLTIAFLDESFTIMQLNDMQPLSDELHCADEPANFALEVNQGWFEVRGIGLGDQLEATLP